jgi:hypothetical protein
VYDSIIDNDPSKNAFGLFMSLNMLIETPGGYDYTGADCMGGMKEAGFRETRVEHLVGHDSMVVGIKSALLRASAANEFARATHLPPLYLRICDNRHQEAITKEGLRCSAYPRHLRF